MPTPPPGICGYLRVSDRDKPVYEPEETKQKKKTPKNGETTGEKKRQGQGTYRDIKVVLAEIATSVGRLHNHLLAIDRPTRKSKLVAGAAPVRLSLAVDAHRRPAVGEVVVDGPRAVARAHVRAAAVVAAGRGAAAVVEGVVAPITRAEGSLGQATLARPRARGLAAVPVAGRGSGAAGLRGGADDEGRDGRERREGDLHRVRGVRKEGMDMGRGWGWGEWE